MRYIIIIAVLTLTSITLAKEKPKTWVDLNLENADLKAEIVSLKAEIEKLKEKIYQKRAEVSETRREQRRLISLCKKNGVDCRNDEQKRKEQRKQKNIQNAAFAKLYEKYGYRFALYGGKYYYTGDSLTDYGIDTCYHINGKVLNILNDSELLIIRRDAVYHIFGYPTEKLFSDSSFHEYCLFIGKYEYIAKSGEQRVRSGFCIPSGLTEKEFKIMLESFETIPPLFSSWKIVPSANKKDKRTIPQRR
jgi:hypothetical protein